MKKNNSKKFKRTKWIKLDELKYPLHGVDGSVILPAGTKDVDVAFRCGSFTYLDERTGERVRANKYRDSSGRIYYGH